MEHEGWSTFFGWRKGGARGVEHMFWGGGNYPPGGVEDVFRVEHSMLQRWNAACAKLKNYMPASTS